MPEGYERLVQKYREYYSSEEMVFQEDVLPMLGDVLDPQLPEPENSYIPGTLGAPGTVVDSAPIREAIGKLQATFGDFVPPYVTNFLQSPQALSVAQRYVQAAEYWYYENKKAVPITSLADLETEDFALLTPEMYAVQDRLTTIHNQQLLMQQQARQRAEHTAARQLELMIKHAALRDADFFRASTGETISGAELRRLIGLAETTPIEPEGGDLASTVDSALKDQLEFFGVTFDDRMLDTFRANDFLNEELDALMETNYKHEIDKLRAELLGLPAPAAPAGPISYQEAEAMERRVTGEDVILAPLRGIGVGLRWLGGKALDVAERVINNLPESEIQVSYEVADNSHYNAYTETAMDMRRSEWLEREKARIESAFADGGDASNALYTEFALSSFEELARQDPDTASSLVAASGGDVNLARTVYAGFIMSGESGEQINQMLEQQKEDATEFFFSALEEEDFTPSAALLDTLAAWGKYVPGALATGLMLFLEDEDFRDDIAAGEMGNAWEQISKHDFRPSSVLGWEGTFMGLTVDLGLTGVLDPTTWFFAPRRGAHAMSLFSSADEVTGWLEHTAVGRRTFRDMYTITARTFSDEWKGAISPAASRATVFYGMPLNIRSRVVGAIRAGDEAAARQGMTDAMLLGWRPNRGGGVLGAIHQGRILNRFFETGTPRHLGRFLTPQNTGTTFAVRTATGFDELIEMFSRLYADDLPRFNQIADVLDKEMMGRVARQEELLLAQEEAVRLAHQEYDLFTRLADGRVRPRGEQITLRGRTYENLGAAVDDLRGIAAGADPQTAAQLTKEADGVEAAYRRLTASYTADEWAEFGDTLFMAPDEFGEAAAARYAGDYGDEALGIADNAFSEDAPMLLAQTVGDGAAPVLSVGRRGGGVYRVAQEAGDKLHYSPDGAVVAATLQITVQGDAIVSAVLHSAAGESAGMRWLLDAARDIYGPGVVGVHGEKLLNVLRGGKSSSAALYSAATAQLRRELQAPWLRRKLHSLRQKYDSEVAAMNDVSRATGWSGFKERVLSMYEEAVLGDSALATIPGLISVSDDGVKRVNWDILRGRPTPGLARPSAPAQQVADASVSESVKDTIVNLIPEFRDDGLLHLPVAPIDIAMARGAAWRAINGKLPEGKFAAFSKAATDLGVVPAGLKPAARKAHLAYLYHLQKMSHAATVTKIRDLVRLGNHLWVYDKVMRPATAITVALDEVTRMIHSLGVRETLPDYVADKLARTLQRWERRRGGVPVTEELSENAARIINRVDSYVRSRPEQLASVTKNILNRRGEAAVIAAGDTGYHAAAAGYAKIYLGNEGFRLWLSGDMAAMRSYYDDAARSGHLRRSYIHDTTTDGRWYYRNPKFEEVVAGYETIFKAIFGRGDPENLASLRARWSTVSNRYQAAVLGKDPLADNIITSSARLLDTMREIPIWTTGAKADANSLVRGAQGTINAFEKMFESQFAFREGFLSRYARTAERERVEALLTSQGIRVIPDEAVAEFLASRGLPPTRLSGHVVSEDLLRHKIVTRSYVENMAEAEAMRMTQDMLYKWHLTTPAGRTSRYVYPFGKPWADMGSFWFRRTGERPVLRGYRPSAEHATRTKVLSAIQDNWPSPILPNRSAAFLSRTAAADFDLENQEFSFRLPWAWLENMPGVGDNLAGLGRNMFGNELNVQGIDAGSAMFLPTAGDNIFATTLPSMGGALGVGFLDIMDRLLPEPDEDPEGFFRFMESIAPIIDPMFAGGDKRSYLQKLLSGGWLSVITNTIYSQGNFGTDNSLFALFNPGGVGETYTPLQLEVNRAIVNLMADPQYLTQLLSASEDELKERFPGLSDTEIGTSIMEAEIATLQEDAVGRMTFGTMLRQVLPLRADVNIGAEENIEAWLGAAEFFGETLLDSGDLVGLRNASTAEEFQQYATRARNNFFAQPLEERVAMIIRYPGLAAAGIQMYMWNPMLMDAIPGASPTTPYRYGNSVLAPDGIEPPELATEEFFRLKSDGFLVPRPTTEIYRLVWANYFNAYETAHRLVWEQAVSALNEAVLADFMEQNPGAVLTEEDKDAFSSTWQGDFMDEEGNFGISQRLAAVPLPSSIQQLSPLATTLGIKSTDLAPGATYGDLYALLAGRKTEYTSHPMYWQAKAMLQRDLGAMSEQADTLMRGLRGIDISRNSPSDRLYQSYVVMNDLLEEFGLNDSRTQEAVNDFRHRFAVIADLYPANGYRSAWNDNFAARLGPFPGDTELPKPPGFDDIDPDTGEAGTHPRYLPGAVQPYVWDTLDGDTFVVSYNYGENPRPGLRVDLPILPALPNMDRLGPIDFTHDPEKESVRLIGVRAAEKDADTLEERQQAEEDWTKLFDALHDAPPGSIWLVPDVENFGAVDRYGRRLFWLWINGEWYYSEDAIRASDF